MASATPAIVLVDYNGLEDTRRCLESLRSQAAKIIVVDNASRIAVAPELQPLFPEVIFLRSETNGGWAGGNNLGMHHAIALGHDPIILLNNDTTVEPAFTTRLIAAFDRHPGYGILGPVIRFMEPPHEVQTEGVRFNTPAEAGFFQRISVPLTTTEPPTVVDVDIVNGCCLMVRKAVVDRIGGIDDAFFLIHEESDFCLRAQEAGFKLGVLAESLVFHKGSSTFAREGQGTQRYYDSRNLFRLLGRHRAAAGRRTHRQSVMHAIRYCLSRYSLEREKGFTTSAEAVLAGMYDAIAGRVGMRSDRPRWGLALLRFAVNTLWILKHRRAE